MPHANTGYALLFLVKAMAPVSNGSAENRGLYAAEAPETAVHFRAAVRSDVTSWVSGFGTGVVDANTVTLPDAEGMFVNEVRYYVDGEIAERVPGTPSKPWDGERYGAKLKFARNGTFNIQIGVVVRSEEEAGGERELLSEVLAVDVRGILEGWMLEHAAFEAANQLATTRVQATASSANGKFTTADRAVDGIDGSRWLCKEGDANPTLTIDIPKAVWADTLVLCQADSHPSEVGRHARVKRVAFKINNSKRATEVEFGTDVLRPGQFELPKRIRVRRIEIEILEVEPGSEHSAAAGFSEVGLTDRR